MDNKDNIITVFKHCLNILRDNEGLTPIKALRNLSYLFILKFIEPYFQHEINIDEYNYEITCIDNDVVKYKTWLLQVVRFTNLVNENEDNIQTILSNLWEDILSNHPTTMKIFQKGEFFDIKHNSTYKLIIDKLHSIDLKNTEDDVLGNVYEEVIQSIMTGKILGQFFTQPLIKKLMVKLIDPQIHPDGKIDTCGDPSMGTGGLLITYLQNIIKQAKTKNITLDWEFIKNEGLYGKELEPDTFQLAISNMLISSGHMFEKLDRGDSIRYPITRKFDNILANPPFGIKGLKYDNVYSSIKNEYVPIKTDNAVSLFIQAIIYMLKTDGKCAVVIPYGQDLFGKSNKTLIAIREYLVKTCDLKKIICLPPGMFTYTSIKTCIYYFIKKLDGTDVLETKIWTSKKTKKEIGRDYIFSKTHQTTNVKFYEYDPYEDIETLLVEVPIESIESNSYSLNYSEYLPKEEKERNDKGCVVKTLGEVCEIQKGKRIVKNNVQTGDYPVLGGGGFTNFHTNEFTREGKTCKISREGMSRHNCVMMLNEKYFLNSQAFTIISNNENLSNEYLWYYLDNNKCQVYKCGRGVAQKSIDIEEFKKIRIPMPSLVQQKEIIEYLDFINNKVNNTNLLKIQELKQLNEYCIKNQKLFSNNVVKTLGEVCEIQKGKRIVKNNVQTGDYPVLGGGGLTNFYTNKFTREGKTCKISREGMSPHNCVMMLNEKYFLNSQAFTIISNNDMISNEYLWYYLDNNKSQVYKCGRGVAQKSIDIEIFNLIMIQIPSLEQQKEIVEYIGSNEELINQLEKEIDKNKKLGENFLTSILNTN
jgi:type I restriction-modification system DNA methylase subunit